jgi:hypothetical protein
MSQTFGKTFDGASSSASSADKTSVSSAAPASSGTVTQGSARVWLSATGSTTVNCVIYANSGGAPGALLATSNSVTLTATAEAQVDFTFSGANQIAIASGTTYWIGVSWQDPGTPSLNLSRDATASGRQEASAYLPNPFGTPTALTGPVDVFITYELPGTGDNGDFFAFFGTW